MFQKEYFDEKYYHHSNFKAIVNFMPNLMCLDDLDMLDYMVFIFRLASLKNYIEGKRGKVGSGFSLVTYICIKNNFDNKQNNVGVKLS